MSEDQQPSATRWGRRESDVFTRIGSELERRTKLDALEARGTLALALKLAGVLSRDVASAEIGRAIEDFLPGELKARGIRDADEVCAALRELLE